MFSAADEPAEAASGRAERGKKEPAGPGVEAPPPAAAAPAAHWTAADEEARRGRPIGERRHGRPPLEKRRRPLTGTSVLAQLSLGHQFAKSLVRV